MYQMPMLRLELEHMKQAMVVALSDYNGEIEKEINAQLQSTVKNFDFEAVVFPIANKAINDAVTSYFSYGNGRKIIDAAITEALDKAFRRESEA